MIVTKRPSAVTRADPDGDSIFLSDPGAYAINPLIAERGSTLSRHADTDISALQAIQRRRNCLFTTEQVVSQRTGIPLLTD